MKEQYALQFFLNLTNKDINIVPKMIEFSEFVANLVGIKYDKMHYHFKDTNKTKSGSRKYSKEAVEAVYAFPSSDLSLLTFESLRKKHPCVQSVVTLNFLLSFREDYPSRIQLVLDPTFLRSNFPIYAFNDCIEHMILLDFKLEYGMGTFIDEDKWPIMYLTGVKTPGMNQQERDLVDALSLNMRDFKNKVWDLFVYNVIKKEILSTDMINEIHSTLSPDQYLEMKGYFIFWLANCPDLLRANENDFSDIKNKMIQLLSHEGRIMKNIRD